MEKLITLMAMTFIITSCDEAILLEGASELETRSNLPQTIECVEEVLYLFGNEISFNGRHGNCEAVTTSEGDESEEINPPEEMGEGEEEISRSSFSARNNRKEASRRSTKVFYTPHESDFRGTDRCSSNGGSDIVIDYTDPENPRCSIYTYTL